MRHALGLAAIGAFAAGCATMAPSGPSAVADLAPTAGNAAKGTVTFTQKGDKVVVVASVSGLAPGQHGFHIHEKGDCSSTDGMSAGGHFNPMTKPHAHPTTLWKRRSLACSTPSIGHMTRSRAPRKPRPR